MPSGQMDGELRLALLGAGGMGYPWSKVIAQQPNARFAAIVDPLIGSDRQSPWLSEFDSIPKFQSLEHAAGAGLDAVVVTAHSTVHAPILREALQRGLHALVEKPFVTTYADAEELVGLAESRGLTLMVSQNYRFFPGARMIREIVADRRYGDLLAVFGEFWCDWPGKAYQHGMQHVMGLEMAVHHFDMCRAMFDADPVGGYVREWQPKECRYAGGAAMEAVFDMKGKSIDFPFTYSGSLIGHAPKTPWPGVWRIEFDTETLVVDTIEGRYGIYRAHENGFDWLGPMDPEGMSFNVPLAHFLESIRERKAPWSSGRDNLGTLKMTLGAEFFGHR